MGYIGELSALGASLVWAVAGVLTEDAARRANATDLNLFVKASGYLMITLITVLLGNSFFPMGVSGASWLWLVLSGIFGFALGDSYLFKAYHLIGVKIALLIFSLAPAITAILSWIFFAETLTRFNILGMLLVLSGIVLVILEGGSAKVRLRFPLRGILAALMAAVGQSLGVLLSKQGMANYNIFTVTQVRLIGGILALGIMVFLRRSESNFGVFKDAKLSAMTLFNSFLGTVIGVSLSMIAIANTKAAIASTLMAVSPIMVIPVTVFFLRQKMELREVAGAAISVIGIAVLFIQ